MTIHKMKEKLTISLKGLSMIPSCKYIQNGVNRMKSNIVI